MGPGVAAASDVSCQLLQDFGTFSNLNFLKKFLPAHEYPSDE